MRAYLRALKTVTSNYAPSRTLSFGAVHILKALQLIHFNGHASRQMLCQELLLGEGSIKTLIKHLKMNNMIHTSNSGTKMTAKGSGIYSELSSAIPGESALQECSVTVGKYNYAVLLKSLSYAIHSGIEQRDAAIKVGGTGATTLFYKDSTFFMPASGRNNICLKNDQTLYNILLKRLNPNCDDVIIIGSANNNRRIAELAAKNAALQTLFNNASI